MKNLLFLITAAVLLCSGTTLAQEQYRVNGNTYTLKTEVEGPLTLLWNVIDGQYRFFVKKGDTIRELKNTREDGKYREEYKKTLADLTRDQEVPTDKVKLTLLSLRNFVNEYNKNVDPTYEAKEVGVALVTRLGAYAGISNNIYTTNPENSFAPNYGIEFEVTDNDLLKRHSLVLQFRQSVNVADYDLYYSQFSLNYRFKFIHSEKISVFIQAKTATLTFFERDEDNVEGLKDNSGSTLQTPFGLGVGLDYKLGNGYLTFGYNDIVAPGWDDNGNFPLDFTLGYKINL